MLNYEVDPALLARHVPAGTELDLWQGRCLVSVVGFMFLRTRVLGLPIPGHRDFEEVNLRFYVRHPAADGWRRGVVFIREIVPRWAIAWLARTVYGEPYVALPMRHHVDCRDDDPLALRGGGRVHYGWRTAHGWVGIDARLGAAPAAPAPGSEEEFITEHYWGYTAAGDGRTTEYGVEHPPWRVWPVEACTFGAVDATVTGAAVTDLYGAGFVAPLLEQPVSAFVAEGSELVVRRGRRIG
jgi:hypothetical protein